MNLLESMRIYVVVVEHGCLARAATELQIGESEISERIDCLERYLDCHLLLRHAHDVTCTDAGAAFHERCRTTLSAVEQAIAETGRRAPDARDH